MIDELEQHPQGLLLKERSLIINHMATIARMQTFPFLYTFQGRVSLVANQIGNRIQALRVGDGLQSISNRIHDCIEKIQNFGLATLCFIGPKTEYFNEYLKKARGDKIFSRSRCRWR